MTKDPDPLLDRYGVRYVMWTSDGSLAVFLAHDPAWRKVYRSGAAVVFERISPRSAPAG